MTLIQSKIDELYTKAGCELKMIPDVRISPMKSMLMLFLNGETNYLHIFVHNIVREMTSFMLNDLSKYNITKSGFIFKIISNNDISSEFETKIINELDKCKLTNFDPNRRQR